MAIHGMLTEIYRSPLVLLLCLHAVVSLQSYHLERICSKVLRMNRKHALAIDFNEKWVVSSRLTECTLTVAPAYDNPSTRFQFFFTKLAIPECSASGLEILEGGRQHREFHRTLCGATDTLTLEQPFTARGHLSLRVKWNRNAPLLGNSFRIVLTSYTIGRCLLSDVRCNNTRCVHRNLQCSGLNPCGDHSDCNIRQKSGEPPTWFVNGVMVTGALIILALCIGCCREQGSNICLCIAETLRLMVSGCHHVWFCVKWLFLKVFQKCRKAYGVCRSYCVRTPGRCVSQNVTEAQTVNVTSVIPTLQGLRRSSQDSSEDDRNASTGDSSESSSGLSMYENSAYSGEIDIAPSVSPPSYSEVANNWVIPAISLPSDSQGSGDVTTTERQESSASPPPYSAVVENYEMYNVKHE